MLRHDNADLRLREYGYQVGLISESQYQKFLDKKKQILELTEFLKNTKITPSKENMSKLENLNTPMLKDGISCYDFLKRPEITIELLKENGLLEINYDQEVIEQVEINIKYDGYIIKEQKEAEKMLKLEDKKIPVDIDYDKISNLASEARQKLKEVNPTSIGQALSVKSIRTILWITSRKK